LEPSWLVSINGELGAGKTQLVQGIVKGLGCTELAISPTYTLLVPYQGRVTVHHGDAYRIRSGDEVFELGIEELLADGALVLMEWGDRIAPWLPTVSMRIEIQTVDATSRRIEIAVDRPDWIAKVRHSLDSCLISAEQSLPVQS
jgi:tRNA threonylcarbamoyladenosine biosynthesis protein TsaE